MCIFRGEKMEEKTLTSFSVETITIGNRQFMPKGVVEIKESYIQFDVSSQSDLSASIQVKIRGEDIQTVCFNYWSGRGNILLLIDENAVKSIFYLLGLSRINVIPHILSYWR